MDRRVVLDRDAAQVPRPLEVRAPLFTSRGRRGRGVWRYSRGSIASLLGLRPSALHSAERRGELRLGDLASVAAFITKRLERAARRELRDKRRTMSVNEVER